MIYGHNDDILNLFNHKLIADVVNYKNVNEIGANVFELSKYSLRFNYVILSPGCVWVFKICLYLS